MFYNNCKLITCLLSNINISCQIIVGFYIIHTISRMYKMSINQHSPSSSTLPDECNLFCTSVKRIGTLFKAICSSFEVSSPEVNWGIDSKQTALRKYWCVSESSAFKRPSDAAGTLWKVPLMSTRWKVISSSSVHCTALHYTPALAPYHIQSSFSSAVEFTYCRRDQMASSVTQWSQDAHML